MHGSHIANEHSFSWKSNRKFGKMIMKIRYKGGRGGGALLDFYQGYFKNWYFQRSTKYKI
jgi:hypothetical protein